MDMEDEVPVGNWEEFKEKGNNAFKTGALDTAIDYYTKGIDLKPDEAVLYSNRSASYLKKKDYSNAVADAKRAIELDKTFFKAYPRAHTALCNMGEFKEAQTLIQNALDSLSGAACSKEDLATLKKLQATAAEADAAYTKAKEMLTEGGQEGDVVRILGGSVANFPDCPALTFLYAEAKVVADPDDAQQKLTPFAYSHSTDTYYLYLRALTMYYRGQEGLKSAQSVLREILGMDPDYAKAAVLLKKIRQIDAKREQGNTAFKEKRSREAEEAYTSAVDLDPTNTRLNAILRGNRAAARMDLKDFKGALMDCDFSLKNGNTSAKLYARRSRINEQLGQFEDALRDMQEAAGTERSFEAELKQLKVRAKRALRKDYYKTLNLTTNESDLETIKRAYKKSCLQWHPDKWAHASEEEKEHAEKQFKEVGEAYGVLSDPQKKRMYDSGMMDNDVEGASSGPSPFGGGFGGGFGGNPYGQDDMAQMMNMFFRSQGGGFSFGGAPHGQRQRRGRGGMPPGFTF
ncbi:DnaJ like protein subfamily C member 7 [Angomonas deanei]|nr:DnaJ like protein subfamily C member 7 [Angomonas deanei]EPY34425.1 DnaJ like protein subfamily C member 7 [Angomonas deanei]EPY38900.1 DnaJ like protein subfamily C member 7 [Angomonas deanei]|eukprot:EPY29232.1 DnaJ like protein subfamily C member 7 [Angomonas deanei]